MNKILQDFPSPHFGVRVTSIASSVQLIHPPILGSRNRQVGLADVDLKAGIHKFCNDGSPEHLVEVGKQLHWEFFTAMGLTQLLGVHAFNFDRHELERAATDPVYVDVNTGYQVRQTEIKEHSMPKSSPREKITVDLNGLDPYSGDTKVLLLEILRRQYKAVAASVSSRSGTAFYIENGLYIGVRGGASARIAVVGAWSTYAVDK